MFTTIRNSVMLKSVAIFLAFNMLSPSFAFAFAPSLDEGKVTVKAGTPVFLETTKIISSRYLKVGQTIDLRVRYDVKVDDKVVIKAGSLAKGQVIRARKAKGVGQEGLIDIEMKSIQFVDGQVAPLAGDSLFTEGDDRMALALGLGILVCLLFLLIKGKNGEIPAGKMVDTSVAMEMKVAVAE